MELGKVGEYDIQGSQELYIDSCCGPQFSFKSSCKTKLQLVPKLEGKQGKASLSK
jgi:hypothetical protein